MFSSFESPFQFKRDEIKVNLQILFKILDLVDFISPKKYFTDLLMENDAVQHYIIIMCTMRYLMTMREPFRPNAGVEQAWF